MGKVTCGVLWNEAMSQIVKRTTDPILLFASGRVCGQAEKIYLGACSAAMFRPSPEYRDQLFISLGICSSVYRLEVSVFERVPDEIWLYTPDVGFILAECLNSNIEVNSPGWHYIRGLMCGIPQDKIDYEFHLRKGYRKPCDRIEEWELNRPSAG